MNLTVIGMGGKETRMRKLLSANFMSIKKSKLFWVCIVVIILTVIYKVFCTPYDAYQLGMPYSADDVF